MVDRSARWRRRWKLQKPPPQIYFAHMMLAYSPRWMEDRPRGGWILRLHLPHKRRYSYHPRDMPLPWANLEIHRPWDPLGTDKILGEGADEVRDLDIEGRLWGAHMRGVGSHCNNVLVRRNNVHQEERNDRHGDWAVEIPGPYFAGSCNLGGRMVPGKAWGLHNRFG